MSDNDFANVESRLAAITPGDWDVYTEIDGVLAGRNTVVRVLGGHRIVTVGQTRRHDTVHAEANIEFIAHAPDDIRALLAENARLREDLARANAVADSMQHFAGVADRCEAISNRYAEKHEKLRAVLDDWGLTGDGEDEFAEAVRESGGWRFRRDLLAALDETDDV